MWQITLWVHLTRSWGVCLCGPTPVGLNHSDQGLEQTTELIFFSSKFILHAWHSSGSVCSSGSFHISGQLIFRPSPQLVSLLVIRPSNLTWNFTTSLPVSSTSYLTLQLLGKLTASTPCKPIPSNHCVHGLGVCPALCVCMCVLFLQRGWTSPLRNNPITFLLFAVVVIVSPQYKEREKWITALVYTRYIFRRY